jgi:hypothetical protein
VDARAHGKQDEGKRKQGRALIDFFIFISYNHAPQNVCDQVTKKQKKVRTLKGYSKREH